MFEKPFCLFHLIPASLLCTSALLVEANFINELECALVMLKFEDSAVGSKGANFYQVSHLNVDI